MIFDLERIVDGEPIRELVMLPPTAPRFVRLPGDPARYVCTETIVKRFAPLLFPGYVVHGAAAFGCCATAISRSRKRRRIWSATSPMRSSAAGAGRVIRLELETGMPDALAAV